MVNENTEVVLKSVTDGQSKELSVIDNLPARIEEVKAQVGAVQRITNELFVKETHFGVIPGCPLPSMYQPGAEVLALAFRLIPKYHVTVSKLENSHREYICDCYLEDGSGKIVGHAQASCSTMEKRYRWRKNYIETEAGALPKEFWNHKHDREAGQKYLQELFGPGNYKPKKTDAGWIALRIEGDDKPKENEDIADCYNTCLQQAQKRAFVRAIRNRTAASSMFTQDVEEMPDFTSFADARQSAADAEATATKTTKPAKQKAEFVYETVPPQAARPAAPAPTQVVEKPVATPTPKPEAAPEVLPTGFEGYADVVPEVVPADPESPEYVAWNTCLSQGKSAGEKIGEQEIAYLQNYYANYSKKKLLSNNEAAAIKVVLSYKKQNQAPLAEPELVEPEEKPTTVADVQAAFPGSTVEPPKPKRIDQMSAEELGQIPMHQDSKHKDKVLKDVPRDYLVKFCDKNKAALEKWFLQACFRYLQLVPKQIVPNTSLAEDELPM